MKTIKELRIGMIENVTLCLVGRSEDQRGPRYGSLDDASASPDRIALDQYSRIKSARYALDFDDL